MEPIQALDAERRSQVIAATHARIEHARELYGCDLDLIPVSFDLTGRAAGMYKASGGRRLIRYNPYIFAKYFADNLQTTVAHEVAHYVTEQLQMRRGRSGRCMHRVRPHGREWQKVMEDFGADPSRTANFDMEGLPQRSYTYYPYACGCRRHELGSRRHKRVLRREVKYYCRVCGSELEQVLGGTSRPGDSRA